MREARAARLSRATHNEATPTCLGHQAGDEGFAMAMRMPSCVGPGRMPRPGTRAPRPRAGIRPRHSIHDSIIHRMAGGSAAASRPTPARAAEGRKGGSFTFSFSVLGLKGKGRARN